MNIYQSFGIVSFSGALFAHNMHYIIKDCFNIHTIYTAIHYILIYLPSTESTFYS